ncbi:MAG: recombinase family protein [Verrucomicrobium sp.]
MHIPRTESPKDVGIWIRVSTEEQAQGDSPEHHLERAKSYCASRGWKIREVYDLAGQSGKSVMQHPEAQRMMKDVKRGHISGLVFSKQARLSRNLREVQDFSDFFDTHHADLISLSEAIDTSTAGGRMFFNLLGVFAQWEREEIAERVSASVLTRAKLGKTINGQAPYGYVWKDKKLVLHPEEAPIRRQAFTLFLQHRRKGTVAKLLTAAGYRTREGNDWHDMQVARVLTDPSAKGTYIFNKYRKHGPWVNTIKPENEWGKVDCEPLVPLETWNQVNQLIEEQSKGRKRPGPPPVHVFGHLTRCACGTKMYVRTGTPRYFCRKCLNKIPMDDLEAIFLEESKAFFADASRVSRCLSEAQKGLAEKEEALGAHEREIAKVREEMGRTHRLYLDGSVTSQGFGDFYKPAEQRLNQLLSELPRLQAEVDLLKVNKLSTDDVVSEATTLYDRWPKMGTDEKRKIAEALVEKIVIGDREVTITYSHLAGSEEACTNQQELRQG